MLEYSPDEKWMKYGSQIALLEYGGDTKNRGGGDTSRRDTGPLLRLVEADRSWP